jgi:predicted nucleic acid-binding protein
VTTHSVVVDTGVFGAALGSDPRKLRSLYAGDLAGARLVISFQTVAELRYGAINATWGSAKVSEMERQIARAAIVPPHDELAHEWARLRAECRTAGHGLAHKPHRADLWIAATARLADLPLVTHDTVFVGTPGLDVICHA